MKRDTAWWKNARRSTLAGLLLLGSVSAAPVFASEASSKESSKLEAEVACDGTVTWTTSSSDSDKGSNPDVRVEREVDGADSEEVGQGSFSNANHHRFSGSFEWPEGAEKVVLRSVPKGRWGNSHSTSSHSSEGSSASESESESGDDSVELERPSDCRHRPEVGDSVECHDTDAGEGEGTVTLTLTNPAGPFGHSAHFRVHSPDSESGGSSYDVESGGHESVSFDHLDDGDHSVEIEIDGEKSEHHFSVDCDHTKPSVEQSQACVDGTGSITVVLVNTGGESVKFRVENPVTHVVETITVAKKSSASRTFAGLADGEWTVPIQVGSRDLSRHFTVNCSGGGGGGGECADSKSSSSETVSAMMTASSTETSAPESSAPEASSPETSAPESSAPENTEVENTEVENTEVENTEVENTEVENTEVENTEVENTEVENTEVENTEVEGSAPETTIGGPDGCEHEKGDPVVTFTKECVDHDGQVTITLSVVGGEESIEFDVAGTTYEVEPGAPRQVVIGGLLDGTQVIPISADGHDLSITVTVDCDLPPTVTVTHECVAFDGTVNLLLDNPGDDHAVTFTVNGVDHVVAPGTSTTVSFTALADGTTEITVAINGVIQPVVSVSLDCDPVFSVKAACNTVSAAGATELHWFTITNTEAVDVTVTWPDGSVLVPAGESRVISSTTANLSISYSGVVIASGDASTTPCSKQVTFTKQLIGAPATAETYSVTVWRLVGDAYVAITSFDIAPGSPVTIDLPSTLDPAGIEYKVVETAKGSASTSVVSPSTLLLSGDQGATVSVSVTNGYASVSVAKQADVTTVYPGGFIHYDLTPANTGGLTLNPVQVTDRLPNGVIFIEGSVAGGAGSCSLTDANQPQLVTCTLSNPLDAGATGPTVALTVQVEWNAVAASVLSNTAKAVGVFGGTSIPSEPSGPLSCTPPAAGTVCDISPAVQVTVTDPPPTTTTTVAPTSTVAPTTEPPVTTVPPTDPPVTTVPPTDPPVTTVPPPVTTVDPCTTASCPPVTPPTTVPPTTVPPTDPPVSTIVESTTTAETTTSVAVEPPIPSTTAETTTTLVTATTPAPTTTTKEQSGGLPSTGGNPFPVLLFAFGSVCLGLAMALTRRRLPSR